MLLQHAILGIAVLVLCSCSRSKITELASFEVAAAYSDRGAGSSVEEIIWATESVLIVTASNMRIQAFDPDSSKELWSVEFERSIEAVTCNADHVYVALDAPHSHEKANSIRRLDLATGVDSTPMGIPQPFLVEALVWSPELEVLGILENDALTIYTSDLLTVTKRVPYSGRLPHVTSDGTSVLLAESTGSCTLIDLTDGSIDHIHGPPNQGRNNSFPMDAPFLSNAFHMPGGALIRIIDNSWTTGRIFFHNTPQDVAIEQASKNGHAVAAVHWPSQRLAVSGTEQNLLLFSTKGEALEEVSMATTERSYALSFSPSGSKIAALSADGRIKIFGIR